MDGKGSKLGADTFAALSFLPGQSEIFTRLMFLGSVKAQNYLQTRCKFYDANIKQLKKFMLENKSVALILSIFFLLVIGALIYTSLADSQSIVLFIVFSFSLIILLVLADRLAIKSYQKFISAKQNHLYDMTLFLQTIIPNNNLYELNKIDKIIQRLTIQIDADNPFKAVKSRLTSFGKSIIFPVITFIAGTYSTAVSQMSFEEVFKWASVGITILGILTIIGCFLFNMFKKILCRDYDASIAFREDLLDIKLLHFTSHSSNI